MIKQSLIFISFLLLSFFCCLRAQKSQSVYDYNLYMIQFGRNYTGHEKQMHQKIFNENYKEIKQMKEQGLDVAVSNFSDWNQTQKARFYTFNFTKVKGKLSSVPLSKSTNLFAPPSSFDWKALNRVTSVKDQKTCGSCWAFASTAQFQSALAIANNGSIMYDLAEQYAVQCETVDSDGCGGGMPDEALRLYNRTGIPLETSYPYKNTDYYYGSAMCRTNNTIKLNKTVTSITFYRSLSIQQIQNFVFTNGPQTVGVNADKSGFANVGSSGMITCSATSSINHVVLLYGYNSTHWFIKNSWATSWANNGYAYISKNGDCGISIWIDVMEVNFNFVPPTPPPTPGNSTINIQMTDSYGDGWEGSVIGLRQNGVVVARFGQNFTNGSSSNSSATINGRINTQVVLITAGNSTDQMGFILKFSNLTTVYSLTALTNRTYPGLYIYFTFCPLGNCPPSNITLTISMTDSYGDGWEGTTLGFNQNQKNVGIFGQNFLNGKVTVAQNVTIPGNQNTDIVVFRLGNNTRQVGFQIKTPNGTAIHKRLSGQDFVLTTKFGSFCPIGNCPAIPTSKYYITLVSSCSGWGRNVLGIRQQGVILRNFTLINGTQSSPILIVVKQQTPFQIFPLIFGQKTWEIGFTLRTEVGSIIGQRLPGIPYNPDSILLTFTPGLANEALVYVIDNLSQDLKAEVQPEATEIQKDTKLFILTIIFGVISFVMIISFVLLLVKHLNLVKKLTSEKRYEIQSANTINKDAK